MDKARFLRSVRRTLAEAPDPGLPSSLPPTPASGASPDPARFAEALTEAGGSVSRVSAPGVAAAVADIGHRLGATTAIVTTDIGSFAEAIEAGLKTAGIRTVRPPEGAWRETAAAADLGVTSAVLGIAATGSVLLVPGRDAPRVASLLPAAHLVVLPIERIVPGLEQALASVAEAASQGSSAVLVTGPSRTSDIEMIPVFGVHGPKVLHVLLVDGAAQ
jgi:L-lactate dehydrogenase complex protein LldG